MQAPPCRVSRAAAAIAILALLLSVVHLPPRRPAPTPTKAPVPTVTVAADQRRQPPTATAAPLRQRPPRAPDPRSGHRHPRWSSTTQDVLNDTVVIAQVVSHGPWLAGSAQPAGRQGWRRHRPRRAAERNERQRAGQALTSARRPPPSTPCCTPTLAWWEPMSFRARTCPLCLRGPW